MQLALQKNVNFQKLAKMLKKAGVKHSEIAFVCDVSPQSAYTIMEGNGAKDPRHSIAVGLLELADKYGLEVPLMGSDAA